MDVDQLISTILISLRGGAVYASLALAVVIVYRTSRLLNFAQGEMAMFGIFVTWELGNRGLPIGAAVPIALVLSFVLGAIVEKVLIEKVGSQSHGELPVVVITIGMLLGFNGLAGRMWGRDIKPLSLPFPDWSFKIGATEVTAVTIGIMAILAVEVLLLYILFQKTKIGLGMRAVASNPDSAGLVGVPVAHMRMAGWGLAAAVGTVAGIMSVASLPIPLFDPNVMFASLIFAFAAATLGGYDSPVGAVVGGFIVSFVETFSKIYVDVIGSELSVAAALVVILVVLLVRPQGLFGTQAVTRV